MPAHAAEAAAGEALPPPSLEETPAGEAAARAAAARAAATEGNAGAGGLPARAAEAAPPSAPPAALLPEAPPQSASPPDAAPPPDLVAERSAAAARIRAARLPRGVRERLAELAGRADRGAEGAGPPGAAAVLEEVVALLEAALPAQLALEPGGVAAAVHPAGEAFFSGDPQRMSDDEAARIAGAQLAAAGFARRPRT